MTVTRLGSLRQTLFPWIVPVAAVTVWFAVTVTGHVPQRILPSPITVANSAIALTRSGELPRDLAVSAARAFSGLLIGGGLGFTLGFITGLSTTAHLVFDSSIQMFRTVPNLALLPLVIVWFGIGEEARIFMISAAVFFPLYLNTHHGIRSVDKGLVEMGSVYGLNRGGIFTQIILPAALPSILNGLRLALGTMWVTLIVAETLAAEAGIGTMTAQAREFMRTDIVLVGTIVYALLGKLADAIARLLERKLLPWNPAYSSRG